MLNVSENLTGNTMNDNELKSFYKLIALEEFEQALSLIENETEEIDESEKIIVQALKLKQQLKKNLSFEST